MMKGLNWLKQIVRFDFAENNLKSVAQRAATFI